MSLRSLTVVAAALLVSCGDGGGGDQLAPFKGNVLGGGRSLASYNRLTNDDGSENPRPGENQIVSVTGARVTWIDQFDETRNGRSVGNIYLQDFTSPAGPYEGITAFQSSFAPPSFRTSVGDVVDISGQYTEFQLDDAKTPDRLGWSLPEFVGGRIGLRFDAPYIPIVPVEIPVQDLLSNTTGRQWLSMVVTLKDVTFSSDITKSTNPNVPVTRATINLAPGQSTQYVPQVSNSLFDLVQFVKDFNKARGVAEDTSVQGLKADITGIVSVTFQFQVSPRSAEDIVIK